MEFESEEAAFKWYVWQCRKEALFKIWWRIWNARLLLWWYRLWIRQDEFDKSVDWDGEAYMAMTKERRQWYDKDLCIRRQLAHNRDMQGAKVNATLIIRDILGHLSHTSEWRTAEEQVDYTIAHKDEIMANFDKTMSSLSAKLEIG